MARPRMSSRIRGLRRVSPSTLLGGERTKLPNKTTSVRVTRILQKLQCPRLCNRSQIPPQLCLAHSDPRIPNHKLPTSILCPLRLDRDIALPSIEVDE
jgi:hypothetical protein